MSCVKQKGLLIPVVVSAVVAVGLSGCGTGSMPDSGKSKVGFSGGTPSFEEEIKPIFQKSCATCHNGTNPAAPNWLEYDIAVSKKDALMKRVVVDKTMPPPGMTMSDADRGAIAAWLNSGMKRSGGGSGGAASAGSAGGAGGGVGGSSGGSTSSMAPSAPVSAADTTGIAGTADVAGGAAPLAAPAKTAVCAGCHGGAGMSVVGTIPHLAGQQKDYLVAQLKAFKAGERINALMQLQAAGLSPAEIDELATYYSSLPNKK